MNKLFIVLKNNVLKIKLHIQAAFLLLIVWMMAGSVQAQELLIGLGENTRAPKQNQVKTKALKAAPLSLPFVDDFAKPTNHIPDGDKWADKNVFINNNYAINPPTIGVATFDAFDYKGKLYPAAGPMLFAADTLTSQVIDLAHLPADSIYLSFYFQPGGYGDMPEADDIFTLQFFDNNNQWVDVWSASASLTDSSITTTLNGTPNITKVNDLGTAFYRAHLKIELPQYLHSLFQIRFINYATISINRNTPGRSTTTDHWHLDYVYLDKNRSAANLNLPDVALAAPQLPFGKIYESIPAIHLSSATDDSEMFPDPTVLSLIYRNLGWGAKSITRYFRFLPLYGTGSTVQYPGASENIYDEQTISFQLPVPKYNFTSTDDSAAFQIQSYLTTDNDPSPFRNDLRYNDTSTYIQHFRDYYAYDDGTAENGYGLFGNNTANGKVAVQFNTYKNDSIRGVYMYFNQTVNDANAVPFNITVWSDFNGQPDRVMYIGKVEKPVFKDSLNKFVAYKFDKPIPVQKGVYFYVGWSQLSDAYLNIGFDRNRIHPNKSFFNIRNAWEPSIYEGSLMIRPIFTRTAANFPEDFEPTIPPTPVEESSEFIAYPNPVTSTFFLVEKNVPINAQRVDVYNTSGRLVLKTASPDGSVDVSSLPSGIYIVRVWENNKFKGAKRIVVAK